MMYKKRLEAMELNDYRKILLVRSGRQDHFTAALRTLSARFPAAAIDVLALEKMKQELDPLLGARKVNLIMVPGNGFTRDNIKAALGTGGSYDLVALLYNNVYGRGYREIERCFLGGPSPLIGVDTGLNYTVVKPLESMIRACLPRPLLKALYDIRYLVLTCLVILALLAAEALLFIPALVKKAFTGTVKK